MDLAEFISELNKAGIPTRAQANRVEIELPGVGRITIARRQVPKLQDLLRLLTAPAKTPKTPKAASVKVQKRKPRSRRTRGTEIVLSAKIPVGSVETNIRPAPRSQPTGKNKINLRPLQGGLPGHGKKA
jgi:hypothetical protein